MGKCVRVWGPVRKDVWGGVWKSVWGEWEVCWRVGKDVGSRLGEM